MQSSNVSATPGMFRSPLVPAAAVCFTISALLGLGAMLFLFDGGFQAALTRKILISGIRTESALNAWTLINNVISVVCFLCPAVTAAGLWMALRGQAAKGMNLLSNAARWLLYTVRASGVIALAVVIFRAARYILATIVRDDGLYLLFSSFLMEGLMIVQAVFLFRTLCRFLDSAECSAAGMGYTLSTGKLDPGALPAFTATGLLILGILGLVLSVDRLFSMTIASDGFQQYYKILAADHPGQYLAAASLLIGGIGDILLSRYLKFCKRSSERAVFFARQLHKS